MAFTVKLNDEHDPHRVVSKIITSITWGPRWTYKRTCIWQVRWEWRSPLYLVIRSYGVEENASNMRKSGLRQSVNTRRTKVAHTLPAKVNKKLQSSSCKAFNVTVIGNAGKSWAQQKEQWRRNRGAGGAWAPPTVHRQGAQPPWNCCNCMHLYSYSRLLFD